VRAGSVLRNTALGVGFAVAVLAIWLAFDSRGGDDPLADFVAATPEPTAAPVDTTVEPEPEPSPTPETATFDFEPVPIGSVGQPGSDTVAGVLTFRGNATRTYYGADVPTEPVVRWTFPPEGTICEPEPVGDAALRCGTGWTGQPAVFEREDRTWLVVGAYDGGLHFLDAATGQPIMPAFPFDGPVKGSVTIDPSGSALAYVGSSDGSFRIIAFDRADAPQELWRLDAATVEPVRFSDDWDGAALVIDDLLVVGGENGQLYVIALNRSTDADGLVTVDPELVWNTPTWDDELDAALPEGDENVSVETSISALDTTVWLANSGGLVQGWDLAPISTGDLPVQVFRYWLGDDADSTVVVGPDGELYTGQLLERATTQAQEVGQVVRLDPASAADPLVWGFVDGTEQFRGVLSTVALGGDVVYSTTNGGRLLALDRADGTVRWEKQLTGPTWGSPIVVDDVLIVGDCGGVLRAYDVSDTTIDPPLLWDIALGGCLESTPVVWNGAVYIGSRDGRIFALADN